ncbi:MAG TPA: glucose-6-phosphate dehydrogenase [Candidatus Saccharimonadales bacterium]|nr:glucose-6-phosphate dehydrogenase [Candidatus Saccharimonadales bacterium]
MATSQSPTILVIVGITGDLSKRKLLPAIEQLAASSALSKKTRVIGITRQPLSADDVLKGQKSTTFLRGSLELYQMDLTSQNDYQALKAHVGDIAASLGIDTQTLFYLSIPPQFSRPVVELLGETGFANDPKTKLLLEKPFGTDLSSARELITETKRHFKEEQLYRIDHYLAKEMAQNIIVLRGSNALFRRTWNHDFIEKIEIVASEAIGIEGRAQFYEQTGALRDLVQSHLLQLAALVLMNIPAADSLDDVPALRAQALKNLRIDPKAPVIRGQYHGYQDEVTNPGSLTETYVDVTFSSREERWLGVPIRIITGKALKEKATYIRIVYRKNEDHEANELIIALQPDAGAMLRIWTKVPGYDRRLEQHDLKISLADHSETVPEAYEQVLLDAINANHELFASSEEVLETWRIIQPLLDDWKMNSSLPALYEKATPAGDIAGDETSQ